MGWRLDHDPEIGSLVRSRCSNIRFIEALNRIQQFG
jgi:hypothetical protein